MSNLRFVIVVVVVLIGKPPLMGEVLCSTENSPFLIIDHIHAKINRVCCAALAIGKKCMNVRKNNLFFFNCELMTAFPHSLSLNSNSHYQNFLNPLQLYYKLVDFHRIDSKMFSNLKPLLQSTC